MVGGFVKLKNVGPRCRTVQVLNGNFSPLYHKYSSKCRGQNDKVLNCITMTETK